MELSKVQKGQLADFSKNAKVDAAFNLLERYGAPQGDLAAAQHIILEHFEEYVMLCRQCQAQFTN